jgi:hypothetical protein
MARLTPHHTLRRSLSSELYVTLLFSVTYIPRWRNNLLTSLHDARGLLTTTVTPNRDVSFFIQRFDFIYLVINKVETLYQNAVSIIIYKLPLLCKILSGYRNFCLQDSRFFYNFNHHFWRFVCTNSAYLIIYFYGK